MVLGLRLLQKSERQARQVRQEGVHVCVLQCQVESGEMVFRDVSKAVRDRDELSAVERMSDSNEHTEASIAVALFCVVDDHA